MHTITPQPLLVPPSSSPTPLKKDTDTHIHSHTRTETLPRCLNLHAVETIIWHESGMHHHRALCALRMYSKDNSWYIDYETVQLS